MATFGFGFLNLPEFAKQLLSANKKFVISPDEPAGQRKAKEGLLGNEHPFCESVGATRSVHEVGK